MKSFLILPLAFTAAFSDLSSAAVLVNSTTAPGTTEAFLDVIGKSLAFTTGANAYTLDSVAIRLSRTTGAEPTLSAGIYSSTLSGGNLKQSLQLVSLTTPVVAENSAAASYMLNPTTAFTLAANTTYFFVIYNTSTSGLKWLYDSGAATTSGGYAIPDVVSGGTTQVGWFPDTGTISNPSSWTGASGVYNDFQLNGTLVPEPSALLLSSGLVAITCLRRRRA